MWTEIDVFESTGACNGAMANASTFPSHLHIFNLPNTTAAELPSKCNCELHEGRAPCSIASTHVLDRAQPTFADRFHVASLNWTAEGVTIALDGEVVSKMASPCLLQKIGMDFDRETMPGWMVLPDPATLPDRPFEIDYVRAWRRRPPSAPVGRPEERAAEATVQGTTETGKPFL